MSRSRALAFSMVGGAVAAVMTANVASAEGVGGGFERRHHDGEFMFVFPLLMLLAVAALLVLLWRGRHPVTPTAPPPPPGPPVHMSPTHNAEAILADRLARGEIQPDDYRAAITVLRETAAPG